MKYTFECVGFQPVHKPAANLFICSEKELSIKYNDYSLHSPGLAAVQVLKDIKHTSELEMGMGLWSSDPKRSLNRLNLLPKIYTNSFSSSLQTIEATSNLSCRKWWGGIIPAEPPGPGAVDKSRDTESILLFGFCLSQKVANSLDCLARKTQLACDIPVKNH